MSCLQHGGRAHHDVGALRSETHFAVFVGEADRIIGIGADDRAEPGDAADLLLGRIGEVDDHRAVVGARVFGHQLLDDVDERLEAEVAVDVDVDLVAGVPEQAHPLLEFARAE